MRRAVMASCICLLVALQASLASGDDKQAEQKENIKAIASVAKLSLSDGEKAAGSSAERRQDVVTLGELVAEALENNPQIRAARSRWEAAMKRPSQAGALPDPEFSLMYWNASRFPLPITAIGENPMSFFEPNFSQQIPFPGKLYLKGAIARKEADSLGQEYRMTQLRVVAELKEAYLDLFYIHKAIEIVEKNKDLMEKFARIAEAKYAVGKGIQQDVLKAQVEVSLLVDRLTVLERKRESQVARINSLLNRSPDSPLGRPVEVTKSDFPYTLEKLYAAAEEANPQLKSRRLMVDRSALALDLAKKEYYPDFAISAGRMLMGRFQDMWDIKFSIKLPLYFWRRQRYGVEEAASSLLESRSQHRAAIQEVFFKIKDQFLIAKASERLIDLYGSGIIPQATLSLESAVSGYEVGRVDFLTLLNNLVVLLNYELQYYEQLTEHEKALARLEELVNAQLIRW